MSYLLRPLTVRQSQHLLKFLMVMFNLGLMTEDTFSKTVVHFDDLTVEYDAIFLGISPSEWSHD